MLMDCAFLDQMCIFGSIALSGINIAVFWSHLYLFWIYFAFLDQMSGFKNVSKI